MRSRYRTYYTGLQPLEEEIRAKTIRGAGWEVSIGLPEKSLRDESRSELIIHTRSLERAGAVLSQLMDAITLVKSVSEWRSQFLAVPTDKTERAQMFQSETIPRSRLYMSGIVEAACIAASASRRKRWSYALSLYHLSTTIHANHPMELNPGNFPYQHRSLSPRDQVRFAYAIVTAYAAIETFGLAIHGEAFANGQWISERRRELQNRVSRAGIDPETQLLWQMRGGATTLQRARSLPIIARAEWAQNQIRDCYISVLDAIAYVRWLRARAAAHDLKENASKLSVHDVSNAQQLVRLVLLQSTPFRDSQMP